MIWQIVVLSLHISYTFGGHYETLGISRSATDYDIKKAYKKLARIWHPDKSKSPEANEKFMNINEAYEILSDPEKRKEYDAFGTVSNEPRGYDGFHRGTFFHSSFGNAFFSNEEDTRESRFEAIDFRNYKMNIVPESYKKPSLILLVTHFCMACHQAMRLWGNIADQVSDSGIRMGIADVMRDPRLREELKVHHVPSVVFVIEGQLKYMQADISKETIVEFLRQSFPRDLVSYIYSEGDLNAFHDLWMKDSRSKMLMTKPLDRASFRYLSLAFKHRDKVTAGFIFLDENDNSNFHNIVGAYGLEYDEETLLIFHDEKQIRDKVILPKPVAQIDKPRLTIDEMEILIETHYQLPLSRLLSQSVFDRVCPPPSQKQRSYGFCVIAIVHSKHGHNLSEAENWQYLRSLVDDQYRGKMLYLYGDVQFEFLKSLHLIDHSAIVDVNAFIDQVILLWRQSYESAASMFLSNPWEYPNLDWVLTNWNSFSNLDTAVPILTTKNQLQFKLVESESLAELVDELAAPLIWRIWARLISYLQQISFFVYDNLSDPFTLIIIVLAFILISYSYSTMRAVSQHLSEENNYRSKSKDVTNDKKEKETKEIIQELTDSLYKNLITSNQKGNLVIVMFTTNLTPVHPVEIMVSSISKLKCQIPIEPMSMKLDSHMNWLSSVLGAIANPEDQKQAVMIISSLSKNRPVPEEGIVLALNYSRLYLYICPINMLRDSPFPYEKNNDLHFRNRNLRNATYYLDSESSESDESLSVDKNNSLDNKFFDWLCQLTDGTCKRYHLKEWPAHL